MPKAGNEAVTHIVKLFCKRRGKEKNGGNFLILSSSASGSIGWTLCYCVTLFETQHFPKYVSVFKISMYFLGSLEVLVIALEHTPGQNVKCKLLNTFKMDWLGP